MSDDATWTIGVDLGGTKVVAGLVDEHGAVHATRLDKHARSRDYAAVLDRIATFAAALSGEAAARGRTVSGVGVAIAAFLTPDRDGVREAINLGWPEAALGADLRARLSGLPVAIENDADAAAWGEWRFGAGRGARCLLLVTLGTGVGGGLVTDGRLYAGGVGLALEIGHLQVEPDGRPCPCGAHGCLEQYASGTALGRAASARAHARGTGALALSPITGAQVAALAAAEDPVALAACAEIGGWLGLGLAQAAALLDPSLIVVGGGAGTAHPVLLEAAREAFGRHVGVPRVRPPVPIVPAALGNVAGLVGAADRGRHARAREHEGEPDRGQANGLELT